MRLARSMLPDSILITKLIGNSAYGTIYSTPTSEIASLTLKTKRITSKQGQELIASAFCLHPDTSIIAVGDQVEHENIRYECIAVELCKVGKHVHHIESWLKSAVEG